jgi:hypothetical protein
VCSAFALDCMGWLCCVPFGFKFRRKGFEMDIEVRSSVGNGTRTK